MRCLYLLSVGYSSVVTTSREFQAEMLRPLYRQSIKIIIDSLVPNQRKKQLMPDSTMEPPAGNNMTRLSLFIHKIDSFTSVEVTADTKAKNTRGRDILQEKGLLFIVCTKSQSRYPKSRENVMSYLTC